MHPQIELAPARAICGACGEKIGKHAPCIAFTGQFNTSKTTAFMHLGCLKVAEHFKGLLEEPELSVLYTYKGGK